MYILVVALHRVILVELRDGIAEIRKFSKFPFYASTHTFALLWAGINRKKKQRDVP